MQTTSLLSTFCDLPADWTYFYRLIVDVIDAGGGGGLWCGIFYAYGDSVWGSEF